MHAHWKFDSVACKLCSLVVCSLWLVSGIQQSRCRDRARSLIETWHVRCGWGRCSSIGGPPGGECFASRCCCSESVPQWLARWLQTAAARPWVLAAPRSARPPTPQRSAVPTRVHLGELLGRGTRRKSENVHSNFKVYRRSVGGGGSVSVNYDNCQTAILDMWSLAASRSKITKEVRVAARKMVPPRRFCNFRCFAFSFF